MPESTERGALTEAAYYSLLALHTPMHGYGIMQLVTEISHKRETFIFIYKNSC